MIHKYIGPTFRDETAPYSCEYNAYTHGELVEEIIHDYPDEWGDIKLEDSFNTVCEYSHGRIVRPLSEKLSSRRIVNVRAHGGWTLMNYYVTLED